LRVRRHFKGAEFQQAEAAAGAVGRIELVDAELGAMGVAGKIDQQITQQPVHQPRCQRFLAGTLFERHLLKRDVQLVEIVVARFIHARRLAGGADELAGEQIRQCGMVLPVGNEAAQQIGPPQHGTVCGCGATQCDVVAAAGAGVAPVEHEFFGGEAGQPRGFVERRGIGGERVPVRRGVDIDFNHPRIGRDVEHVDARIGYRAVALDAHAEREAFGHAFDDRNQV
jgi:hypothetical protein